MPNLEQAIIANASLSQLPLPVAIFIGGTSGIGRAMAEAFARYTNGNCHIIIIGRNRRAAESIIASFPKPSSPGAIHEFVQCDATLITNVRSTAAALCKRLTKVNFLVLSLAYPSYQSERETTEGLKDKMALVYYSRWAFVHYLMPPLRSAQELGENARVMSVLSAGTEIAIAVDLDDIGLVRKKYGRFHLLKVGPTYSDLMMEEFATREPGVTFIHIRPGIVHTPMFFPTKFPFKVLNPIIHLILWFIAVSPKECAEYMLYGLLHGEGQTCRLGKWGDDLGMANYLGTPHAREALWEHTTQIINAISGLD
ncbi:NAD(P)-binding protein [Infundibulicybe gibba]|nr:NAD(P)-binding protein [Infundibulicybe gibba]